MLMVRYNKPARQSFDRDPGRVNRAKRAALKKKMGTTHDATECVYGNPQEKGFCTKHLKHH